MNTKNINTDCFVLLEVQETNTQKTYKIEGLAYILVEDVAT